MQISSLFPQEPFICRIKVGVLIIFFYSILFVVVVVVCVFNSLAKLVY